MLVSSQKASKKAKEASQALGDDPTQDLPEGDAAEPLPCQKATAYAPTAVAPSPSAVQPAELPAEPLRHASLEEAEKLGKRIWNRPGKERVSKGQEVWLEKLKKGDDSGYETPISSFVDLRNDKITSNPRITPEYRQQACDICGLGTEVNLSLIHI